MSVHGSILPLKHSFFKLTCRLEVIYVLGGEGTLQSVDSLGPSKYRWKAGVDRLRSGRSRAARHRNVHK